MKIINIKNLNQGIVIIICLFFQKRERELLMLRVNQMRSDLEWRTMQLQSEKESREQQQARNHQRGKPGGLYYIL